MHPASSSTELIVIGAGPAGLSAAYEAARNGLAPLVLEQSMQVGGISRTETHKGYRFDVGGHRFFTKVPEIQQLWEETLGPEFRLTPRLSRIFHNQRFYRYPLNIPETLRNLGPLQSTAALLSFTSARIWRKRDEVTFEDWVTNRFGRCLYEIFFKSYTEKVWGIPCHELQAEWAAQRIKDLCFLTAVRHALWPKQKEGPKSLIDQFHYPRLGPGMMWERLQERVEELGGIVHTRQEVVGIHHGEGKVSAVAVHSEDNGTAVIPADQVISTMALDELILRMSPLPPAPVVEAAQALRYRDFVMVGLILKRPALFADTWIYIHSPQVTVGRIQNFGNWSSDMVPDPQTSSLGMEYFCNRGDAIWSMADEELVRLASEEIESLGLARSTDVVWGTVIRQPKAYPIYDADYQRHLDTIRNWLETLDNLQTIGRNGQHRYNNLDHSMLTGMAAVHRLLGERTDPWQVNMENSYHEERELQQAVSR